MASNLTDLKDFFEREVSDTILTQIYGTSRIMQASNKTQLTIGGKKLPILGNVTAGIVTTRGGKKPVSKPTTGALLIDPTEFAVIVPYHKKMSEDFPELSAKVAKAAVDAISRSFDYTVFTGKDELGNTKPTNFGSFEDLTPVPVSNLSEFYRAVGATNKNGRQADYAILSSALVTHFLSQINTMGVSMIPVIMTGQNTGTIGNIPFVQFNDARAIGYVGAFRSASNWGIDGKLSFTILTEATVDDINLAQQNMHAVRVSADIGFNYFDKDNFTVITAGSPSGS